MQHSSRWNENGHSKGQAHAPSFTFYAMQPAIQSAVKNEFLVHIDWIADKHQVLISTKNIGAEPVVLAIARP